MIQTLLVALAASIPLSGLAWLAAWIVEASGADLRLRLKGWTAALAAPLAMAPIMLAVQALAIRSPIALLHPPLPAQDTPTLAPDQVQAAVEAIPPASTAAPIPWALILLGLIGLGALMRLVGLALALRRVARLAARSEAIADPALARRLGGRVRQADSDAPILAGVIWPVILLPRRLVASLSHDQAVMVCAHERAHLAAGDHLAHLFEEVLVRVFWFNPFLAAIRARLSAAREEACDARALAGCDEARRRAYAHSLIAALKLAGEAEPVAAFTGFRRRGAERRVRAILKPAGPGRLRSLFAAVLAGLGLTGALGGLSLALAAAPLTPPAPPPRPAPPAQAPLAAPPVPPAPPAPPAPPPHRMVMHHVEVQKGKDGSSTTHHKVVLGPQDGEVQSYEFDDWNDLSPEERRRIEQAMKDAKAAAAEASKAREAGRAAREAGRVAREEAMKAREAARLQRFELRTLSEQDRAKLRADVENARRAMREVWTKEFKDDGKVLMRCSVKPDGSADKCERVAGDVMIMGGPAPWRRRAPPPLPPPPPRPAPPLG